MSDAPTPLPSPSTSPTARRILALVISVPIVLFALLAIGRANRPAAAPSAPYTVSVAAGAILIPGVAFIDTFDPATNSNIGTANVWGDANHPSGARPVCAVEDGDRVNVDNSTEAGQT